MRRRATSLDGHEVNLCCEVCNAVVSSFHVYSLGRGECAKLDSKTNLRNQMASRRFQKHRKQCKSHVTVDQMPPSPKAAGSLKQDGTGSVIHHHHASALPLQLFDSMLVTLFQRRVASMRDASDSSTGMRYQYLVCPRMNVALVADYGQDWKFNAQSPDPNSVTLPVRLGLDCRGTVAEFIKSNIAGVSVNDLNELTLPADLDISISHPLIKGTDLRVQWIDVGLAARCFIGLVGVDVLRSRTRAGEHVASDSAGALQSVWQSVCSHFLELETCTSQLVSYKCGHKYYVKQILFRCVQKHEDRLV